MSDEPKAPAEDEDPLEVFWDDLRVATHRRPPTAPPDFADLVEPNDLVIGTSKKRILVIIKPDGTLKYGPEYRPNEAAMLFWEAMGSRRIQAEDRILVIQHMDAILTRLGSVDLQAESLRRQAANAPEDAELERRAQEAVRQVEAVVHQAIELGRGLVRRPEVSMPAFPQEIPRSVVQAPHSDYEGRDGVPLESERLVELPGSDGGQGDLSADGDVPPPRV